MENNAVLKIDERDNLIVALKTLTKGTVISIGDERLILKQDVPEKHKFALQKMGLGDKALMYGVIVGETTSTIDAGDLITTENLKHATADLSAEAVSYQWSPPDSASTVPQEFMGYRRNNGTVGTANYWIFGPLVFCSNQELLLLKDILPRALGYKVPSRYEHYTSKLVEQLKAGVTPSQSLPIISQTIDQSPSPLFPHVDGIRFLTHEAGCGGTTGDARSLCGLLAGYITHPNVAGATVVS
ncbi:MAG: altronate dehydratase family protein, partial [Deltaproteobacteria bacterium]|nr:altronate dehydratase family protein [Deltaproteobacteria bacterium]